MSRLVATNYQTGLKYSFREHGLRSRLIAALAAFVVAFGGALALSSPAQGAPGDVSCFVTVTPSPTPTVTPTATPTDTSTATPTATPTPVLSPTPCPSSSTVTVVVPGQTVTRNQVVYVQEPAPAASTVTVTPSQTPTPLPTRSASPTDTVVVTNPVSHGGGIPLWLIAFLVAVVLAVGLTILGIVKAVKNRRQADAYEYQGAHHLDDRTQVIPAIRNEGGPDHDGLTGLVFGAYDPDLGGVPGKNHPLGYDGYGPEPTNSDTKLTPPVQGS